jgi:hypothetical protein
VKPELVDSEVVIPELVDSGKTSDTGIGRFRSTKCQMTRAQNLVLPQSCAPTLPETMGALHTRCKFLSNLLFPLVITDFIPFAPPFLLSISNSLPLFLLSNLNLFCPAPVPFLLSSFLSRFDKLIWHKEKPQPSDHQISFFVVAGLCLLPWIYVH